MYCTQQIDDQLTWIGGSDRRLNLFENIYPVPNGVSYNSYLLLDEKTVIFDTVDRSISGLFLNNVAHTLNGRTLDYIVINHMEPDHCATLEDLLYRYPQAQVVGNAKTLQMIRQFYSLELNERFHCVAEGDTLCTGSHTLHFYMIPMVHWPEAMITYDETNKTLFSADAFGTFGALNGHLFADEVDFENEWMDEARRYYTNIVGKYGPQVQTALKKAASLDIHMICPLHGPLWRNQLDLILNKYQAWSTYTPEQQGVLIAYASIYGNTENAANILAFRLAAAGVRYIALYDVSVTDPSYILADAFRYSHLVFASSTYNNGIFTKMETLLAELKEHNLQNRKVAVIQNGSWAPVTGKLISEWCNSMKHMELLSEPVTVRSALQPGQENELETLARALAKDMAIDTLSHYFKQGGL